MVLKRKRDVAETDRPACMISALYVLVRSAQLHNPLASLTATDQPSAIYE